ncbi:MAG: hypothetical protein MPJ53_02500 [Alphaproteobacteria bacterium]|nr:hypothetical protein [Alphaproteobacteria bacterium]
MSCGGWCFGGDGICGDGRCCGGVGFFAGGGFVVVSG